MAGAPSVAGAPDQAITLEAQKSVAEALIVDAQLAAQGDPGEWLVGVGEAPSHELDERWRRQVGRVGVIGADAEEGVAVVVVGELEREGLGCWGAAGA